MKKINMPVAIFAVLVAVSAARAEEKSMDFDGRSAGVSAGGVIEAAGKGYFDTYADQEQLHFTASTATVNCGGIDYPVNAMPVMCGGWALPAEFAEEIFKVAYVGARGADNADEISKGSAYGPEQTAVKALGTKLGGVLAGLPENVREDFFRNLRFLNGNLVSAKTDLLEKAVAPDAFEEILNVIMPVAPGAKDIKSVTRSKDEACNASTGAKGRAVLRGCDYQPGYTCNPATCK